MNTHIVYIHTYILICVSLVFIFIKNDKRWCFSFARKRLHDSINNESVRQSNGSKKWLFISVDGNAASRSSSPYRAMGFLSSNYRVNRLTKARDDQQCWFRASGYIGHLPLANKFVCFVCVFTFNHTSAAIHYYNKILHSLKWHTNKIHFFSVFSAPACSNINAVGTLYLVLWPYVFAMVKTKSRANQTEIWIENSNIDAARTHRIAHTWKVHQIL